MAKHVLSFNLDEEPLSIIAIHSDEEDYRLVYWLNQILGVQLRREAEDLEFANHIYAPWYVFENELEFARFVLLPNKTERTQQRRRLIYFQAGLNKCIMYYLNLKKQIIY